MIHGVLNVYKEKGFTSHDVVAKLRGILGQKKIGHTGTLDPDAEGVLPVCLGRATKLCGMLTDKDKCYEAVMLLGVVTDTQDISGQVMESQDAGRVTEEEVRRAVNSYIGEIEQVPPMYSALKVNGKKLYELAREGKVVERKPRQICIHDIEILGLELPRIRLLVHCSKGTYIRTLCHDIGQTLGCGACMEQLTRTKSGDFSIEDSMTLKEIEEIKQRDAIADILIPIDRMFNGYPKVEVSESFEYLACNGNSLPVKAVSAPEDITDGGSVRLYGQDGSFIGIFRYEAGEMEYKVVKMFYLGERN